MRNFITFIVAVFLLYWTIWAVQPLLAPAQLGVGLKDPAPLNQHFEFDVYTSDEKEAGSWIIIRYDDGRVLGFKVVSVTGVRYYPESFARAMNIKHPYIEIDTGAKTRRIDIIDDPTAQLFRDRILQVSAFKPERAAPEQKP